MILDNQVIAISGGVGRLGNAFSRAVVENGGRVIIGDVIKEKGLQLVEDLGEESAIFFYGNLTESSTIDQFIQIGKEKFGHIDAAIHSAYPVSEQWGSRFEDLKAEGLMKDLHHQLGGAIIFSQRMIKYFRERKKGSLVHISSIQGIAAPKFEHYEKTDMVSPIEYSAIKAGIISITRYLAKYCKGENIRVNSISPGGIFDNQPVDFINNYRNSCSSKGLLDPTDITGTLLYLLSDYSKYVTGENIIVDDGWSL